MRENELILNRYRVLEQLGAGGFAKVYRAFDERIARRVAIKVLPLQTTAGKDASRNAQRKLDASALLGLEEARTAAMLSHPSIVSLFDFEIDPDQRVAYLIMEDIDGITLADIPSECLNDEIIAAVLKAVADALIYAHKNGVLHLDIKPANILISHEGQIKLADFGLAQLSQVGRDRNNKHGKAVAGTVGYMPLEQLKGEDVCEATDQWALAAVIYELLSDEYPYFEEIHKKPSLANMLKAQEANEVALLDLGDVVLEGIFTRSLARNPDVRFENIKDFCDALLYELGERAAAAAGKRELKKIIPELISDEPDEYYEHDRKLNRRERRKLQKEQRKNEMRDASSYKDKFNYEGCLSITASTGLKILTATSFVVGLLAWLAPSFLQLTGNNQWLVVQLAAGVFIIGVITGLLLAASRALQRRKDE